MMSRTIDDLTLKDVGRLVEVSIDLLNAMSMMYWEEGGPEPPPPGSDSSYWDAMEAMRGVLSEIGLPQGSYAEFAIRLERVLATDRPQID
jgi:hypothetical protein